MTFSTIPVVCLTLAKWETVSGQFGGYLIEEVQAFEKRHPIGTKARLALTILLYTACRREDAVRLGPPHVRNGRIKFIPAKNEHRANPIPIDIMLLPDLAQIIAATKSGHMTFLTTEYGKLFSANGFGNKISRVVQSSWITTLFGAWGAKGYCNALG